VPGLAESVQKEKMKYAEKARIPQVRACPKITIKNNPQNRFFDEIPGFFLV